MCSSVHKSAALAGATVAWNSVSFVEIKLIVVAKLFVRCDVPHSNNDDARPLVDNNTFRHTIWFTRVIDESGSATFHRSVDDEVMIADPEHVAPYASPIVLPFTVLGNLLSDKFANIFDHHFAFVEWSSRSQSHSLDH